MYLKAVLTVVVGLTDRGARNECRSLHSHNEILCSTFF